ncbi:MAG: Coenzyme F420 hydrogenase/dehydrogenase, beta subunit C-terminal domain [Planctomycetia bacterium]|uniref:Coenzyme F420 hydrogenase/dehydrogenase, beta subunit C-terminal domain n=1 Tax=Candidatus Kuenenia sp. TaxID=2499824 RepID=UPI001DC06A58|nr:Coenzyme F420 hydrogenase/dehydrogenase, beta subunit C-terminal domain [Planctomycetia bacterium]
MITKDLVVETRLCVHCGACGEVCQNGALELFNDRFGNVTSRIKTDKCIKCGLCNKVCPVEALDYEKYASAIVKEGFNASILPYEKCWSAYCFDEDIRFRASSAGVTRTLARFCIENNKVDAVVALAENAEDGLKPEFKIFKDGESLAMLANSKYCPVSFGGVIRALCLENKLQRILFIGLPCHIRAMRKAFTSIPQLRGRSLIAIGIFCKKTKDIRYSRYLAASLRCGKGPYQRFQFRGDGWPGVIKITTSKTMVSRLFNTAATASFPWRWYLFSPVSCLFCYDSFAREADIAVGDPWLDKYVRSPASSKGVSFVVAHTLVGKELIDGCDTIIKEDVPMDDVVSSQSLNEILAKVHCAEGRLQVVLKRSIEGVHWSQLVNAYWFLGLKKLFEQIFQYDIFVRIPNIFFKVLNKCPQSLFSNKK